MFHGADEQAARLEGGGAAQKGCLDRFTPPGTPHHLLRVGPEIQGQIHAAALQLFGRRHPKAVKTGGITPGVSPDALHGLERFRAQGGGGAGIEIQTGEWN
jgi:hypothetical protein